MQSEPKSSPQNQYEEKNNLQIVKINTKRTYGQPIEQLFQKRWPLSNPNQTKNNMNTESLLSGFLTRSDTNQVVKPQKMHSMLEISDLQVTKIILSKQQITKALTSSHGSADDLHFCFVCFLHV